MVVPAFINDEIVPVAPEETSAPVANASQEATSTPVVNTPEEVSSVANTSQDEELSSSVASASQDEELSSSVASASQDEELSSSVASASQDEELSFAEMLEQQERDEPPHKRFSPGQRVSAKIVAITQDTVFVSTGSKVDGIVDKEELEVDGEFPHKVDDIIDLYVVSADPQEVKLSKIVRGAASITALEDALHAGLPVEGKVTADIKGGFAIEIMKRRAFCPASQMSLQPVSDPTTLIGSVLPFRIIKLENGGRNIVVSHRALLEEDAAESRDALLATLAIGDVREAKITRLAPFGAFVELAPLVEGLIHISELGWGKVGHPDEVVSVDDMVRVKILSIEKDEKNLRISLSMRQVTEDPWNSVKDRLNEGDVVQGKVTRNAPFGAFVEVLPGIEGLIHLSELSYERRILKADEIVVSGDIIEVKIKEIDVEKRRLSLSLRDVSGNPWETMGTSFEVGSEVTGTLEKRAAFGLFVTLAPGITGLLPNSVQGSARGALAKIGVGDAVSVRVTAVNIAERKISLSPVGVESADHVQEEKNWKQHTPQKTESSFSSLGTALQAALKKKD